MPDSHIRTDKYGFPLPGGFDGEPAQPQGPKHRGTVVVVAVLLVAATVMVLAGSGLWPNVRDWAHNLIAGLQGDDQQIPLGEDDAGVEAIYQQAEQNALRGNLMAAERDYSRIIEADPSEQIARIQRGMIRHRMGRLEDAVEDYTAVLESPRGRIADTTLLYQLRAYAYYDLADYPGAVADYGELLERDPTDRARYLNDRAYARALGAFDLETALDEVNEAIELEGDVPAYLDTRGYILYLLERDDEALEDLDRAIRIAERRREPNANLAVYYLHRALIHERLGNDLQARRDRQKLESLDYTPRPGEAR